MKIIGCAYRRWALDIFEHVGNSLDVDITVIKYPEDVKAERFEEVEPEMTLFYGWSWRVSDDIVRNHLCLGLHPAPLPSYRGGSPIQNQIMNGEVASTVSIFKMTSEMDAGDLCAEAPYSLEGDLFEILHRIRDIGSQLTINIIKDYMAGQLKFWPQQGDVHFYKRRQPSDSEITPEELSLATARYLYNKIRSLQPPYPSAFITCADGNKLYLTEASCEP